MKNYVAGFAFTNDFKQVLLVKKARPDWQAGKLNAVGGHVEEGETPAQAMRREFLEETGVPSRDWKEMICLTNPTVGYIVTFFMTIESPSIELKHCADEPVAWYDVMDLATLDTIFNLKWLIPIMMDSLRFPIELQDIGIY